MIFNFQLFRDQSRYDCPSDALNLVAQLAYPRRRQAERRDRVHELLVQRPSEHHLRLVRPDRYHRMASPRPAPHHPAP